MTKEQFLNDMTEILDQDETVSMDAQLSTIEEWDSLGALMFQSKMLERTGKKIPTGDVKEAETVLDLYKLVQN